MISHQFNHTIHEARISDSAIYTCQADNGIAPINPLTGLGSQSAQPGQVVGPSSSFFALSSLFASAIGQNGQNERSITAVEAQLQLQVLYGPRVQVRPGNSTPLKFNPLNEGDYFTLNCSVDSWPPAHEFVWTKQDEPAFKSVQQGPILEFSSVTAQQGGNYTCTAFNRLDPSGYSSQPIDKQASASLQVNIRHKPGLAEIQLGQAGETELGSKTLIQCRAKPPGYPEPQYRFWKYAGLNGQQRAALTRVGLSTGTYTIHSAKPDDEAKYGCLAFNDLGQSTEADGELIVNELPTIKLDNLSGGQLEDSRFVNESPYSITFRASGKPEPKVTWWHRSPLDGRRQELSLPEFQSRYRIEVISAQEKLSQNQMKSRFTVITTLKFNQPLSIEDRGLYSVEFSNGLSASAIEDYQLHIFHAPLPVVGNGVMQVKTSQQSAPVRTKAGFDLGETVNLTCRVSAFPKPNFNWYNGVDSQGKTIDTSLNSRYREQISNIRDDIWESTLTFTQAQESDYGDYMCVSANMDKQTNVISDSVQIFVTLSHKTAPEAPSQLEAIDATQDSITLQWLPGFDGGFAQNHFLVQYAPDDGSGMSLNKRFPHSDSLPMYQSGGSNSLGESEIEGRESVRLFDCQSNNPCMISPLQSKQSYLFRIRAKNERGISEFSDEYRSATRANSSQIPKIHEASFDASQNILHFKIEPESDYIITNLNVRIDVRSSELANSQVQQSGELDQTSDWRIHSTVPMRQEKGEAYLNMQSNIEQLRLTLCSRLNESLCGPEYVISMRSATSSFLHDQRGNMSMIFVLSALLIVSLSGFATIHTCFLSRKSKKADAIERVDSGSLLDNKPTSGDPNGAKNGSTASTNSTSAGDTANSLANGLQSMDSLMMSAGHLNHLALGHHGVGSTSDHSSDHSRQAKLDSMLPPNYNHYADRASILQEQQQQYLQSAYGQANGTLLGVASQQSPALLGHAFSYAPNGYSTEQQPLSLDHHLFSNGLGDPVVPDVQQQHQWPLGDDYTNSNNYSNNALINGLAYQTPEVQQQPPQLDPTYGTTASIMQHQAALYDNGSSSGQFQAYLSACEEQQRASSRSAGSLYQQEIAAAQQQLYGTLTRNAQNGNTSSSNNNTDITKSTLQPNQDTSQLEAQQQHYTAAMAANGLAHSSQLESDYGTVGGSGRNGRLIREIIV